MRVVGRAGGRGDRYMARKTLFFLLMAVACGLWLADARVGAQAERMVIEHPKIFGKLQRPPVHFPHEKHSEMYPNCTECHHNYEYRSGVKTNVWAGEGQECSECHGAEQSGKKPALREAFHGSCTGCHRTLAREGKKHGPSTCGECHVLRPAAGPSPTAGAPAAQGSR